MQRFVLSIGQEDMYFDDETTFTVTGAHAISVPLVPAENKTIGESITRMLCLDESFLIRQGHSLMQGRTCEHMSHAGANCT